MTIKAHTTSDNSLLSTDVFNHLSLPAHTALFVATGVPTVFRCCRRYDWTGDAGDWLYVPQALLGSMMDSLPAEIEADSHDFGKEAFAFDSGILYPIGQAQHVSALYLIQHDYNSEAVYEKTARAISETVSHHVNTLKELTPDVSSLFVKRLFRTDQSLPRFFEQFMSLLCSFWPDCLAGVYYKSGRNLRLRFVSGSLLHTDKIQSNVDGVTASQWAKSISSGEYFRPVDDFPEVPMLLLSAPTCIMHHPGPKSTRTEYMSAMIVPGDIDPGPSQAIIQAAALAAELDDSQFSSVAEINTLYGSIGKSLSSNRKLDDACRDAFAILARQYAIKRLVVERWGKPPFAVVADTDEAPVTYRGDDVIVSATLPDEPTEHNSSIIDDLESVYGEERATKLMDSGVESECRVQYTEPDGNIGRVTVSVASPAEIFEGSTELIQSVVDYIELFASVANLRDSGKLIISDGPLRRDQRHNMGLVTVKEIAEGHFHDILGDLSMVLGQSELIESDSAPGATVISEDQFFTSARKIKNAVDRIAHKIDVLRETTALIEREQTRCISARELIVKLPSIADGFSRSMRDDKNIDVRVTAAPGGTYDFELTTDEALQIVMPLLLSLMREAICSGDLRLSTQKGEGEAELVITFKKQLVGHLATDHLLEKAFPSAKVIESASERGTYSVDSLKVTYRVAGSDTLKICISKPETRGFSGQSQREGNSGERA